MGYIDSFEEIMAMETGFLQYAMNLLKTEYAKEVQILKLEIPVTAGEVKRDSGLYRSYRNVAEQIKEAFDAMGRPEQ